MLMNLDAYLKRINYDGPRDVSQQTLVALHRAHMLAVPFENLDIPLERPIILGVAAHYEKIVTHRRGGFCYEQNGLFAAMLNELGYAVTLMEARVFSGTGDPGIPFGHLTLMVELDERWLADVGFGDSFLEPLRLDTSAVQQRGGRAFRVRHDGTRGVYAMREDEKWRDQHEFFFAPRNLSDFAGACHYHQTSPKSSFTQKRVCSLATPNGRKTISNMQFIVTENGQRDERPIVDEAEYYALLMDHFAISLD